MKPKTLTLGESQARNVYRCVSLEINPDANKRTNWEKQLAHTWGTGDRGEWSHGFCKGCGNDLGDCTGNTVEMLGETISIPVTVCTDCMDIVRTHYNGEGAIPESISLAPKWDEKCPDRLKPVILGEIRPAAIDWGAYQKALEWRTDAPKGLALMGDQGAGKTTALWALFKQLETEGINPILLGSLEMARILAEAARDIKAVTWMYRCRVLMIDDLGKEKATASVAALFWEVLNERYNRNLPIIVTSRFTGEEFEARFGEPHLGEDIRRRMNALCKPLRFTVAASVAA
jgi:IstB-like ATP binding protein